jgi:uncharacterized membrane protein YgcG
MDRLARLAGMEWLLLVVLASVSALYFANRSAVRRRELAAAESLGKVMKVADEDVTRFGEELTSLHVETLTDQLDDAARQDYQRALDAYENAKALLVDVRRPDDVTEVTRALEDGRYARACVLARIAGESLPQRRPPCFFNPAHGPAQTDVTWAPVGGQAREVPVCLADADRLSQGAEPDVRQVRRGNAMVPWFQGGPAYAPYAGGYYGGFAMNGLFPAFILGSMLSGGWDGSYSDGYADGMSEGGSDGFDGGDAGGFDGGGFDGGGFDIGGF